MRTPMVLGMVLTSAVLIGPTSGEAKSGGKNNGGTRVNHTSAGTKSKATSPGAKAPNKSSGPSVGKSTQPASLKGVSKDERGDRKTPQKTKENALGSDSGSKPK
jgi:hypothetical protein